MKIRRRMGLLLVLCVFSIQSFGLKNIDYAPKMLLKQLRKIGVEDFTCLNEINLKPIFGDMFMEGKFFILDNQQLEVSYVYVGRATSCRAEGCSREVSSTAKEGESEYFDYFIFFDKTKAVSMVKVYNYQASHGHEITAKAWLKQFVGFSGNKALEVGKNIDSISGATVSVYAITNDIQIKTELLQKL